MRVKLKPGWSHTYPELTVGNVYRALGIENGSLRIISDAGEPILFHPNAFEFVDPAQPAEWISVRGEDGELYAYPPELRDPPCFFEKFFDYDMRVRQKFHLYVHAMCHQQRAAIPDPPNSYIRVAWKHERPEDPITLYSELDEERWEVRKVEVFRDGRATSADGKGSTGPTSLGDQPVPSVEDIAKSAEFEATQISRREFEEIWDKTLDSDEP